MTANHNSFWLPGTPDTPGKLTLTDNILFFELQLDGDRTPEQVVTILNQGDRTIIRQVSLSLGSEDFEITNGEAVPEYLDDGQSFDIAVDFLARVDGLAIGLIEIWTDEDRLPYTIILKSRTQRTAVFSDLYGDLDGKITQEKIWRLAGDNAEQIARQALNTALRSLISTTNSSQDATRDAIEVLLTQRISNMEASVTNNGGLLTQITDEIQARIAADAYEASMRVALATTVAGLGTTIIEHDGVTYTEFEASVQRISSIEASYINANDATTIANARVTLEQAARVSAITAEAFQRTTLEATLRGETNTALGVQAATFSAAIVVEQVARASALATYATQLTTLTARTSSARGLTPNATFETGSNGWLGNIGFVADANGKISVVSTIGVSQSIYSKDRVQVDPDRAYQLNSSFGTYIHPIFVKIGLQCYDPTGAFLGTIYGSDADGTTLLSGSRSFHNIYTSAETYPIGTEHTGTKFPTGTTEVELSAQVNTSYIAGAYGRVFYLWLDDITNAFSVDARLTTSLSTQSDINGSIITRLDTAEANYSSASTGIAALVAENAQRISDIVTANSRITTEATNRANAVAAEASRIDTILVNYNTSSQTTTAITNAINGEVTARNTAITTAVSAEVTDRTTAIANAISSEVSRVSTLIASYSTTTVTNSVIDSAVAAEATGRNSAIGSAIADEIINRNNAITTATSGEVTDRTTAIANAIAAEVSRVTSVLASYSTTGAVNTLITAAVGTVTTAYAAADAALGSRIDTVTTTLGGHTASITSIATSVDGIAAKYGVEIDVNGYVSGFTQNNSGTHSDFTINAEYFKILKPGGGARTEYSDGTWKVYDSSGTLRVKIGVW